MSGICCGFHCRGTQLFPFHGGRPGVRIFGSFLLNFLRRTQLRRFWQFWREKDMRRELSLQSVCKADLMLPLSLCRHLFFYTSLQNKLLGIERSSAQLWSPSCGEGCRNQRGQLLKQTFSQSSHSQSHLCPHFQRHLVLPVLEPFHDSSELGLYLKTTLELFFIECPSSVCFPVFKILFLFPLFLFSQSLWVYASLKKKLLLVQ